MSAEAVTKALGGKWHGRYGMARCPAHEDREPSLSIADGDGGKLLLKCHAGCRYDDVVSHVPRALAGIEPSRHPVESNRDDAEATQRLLDVIWCKCLPVADTPVENYLRARAICQPLSESLRFHPSLRHPSGRSAPAMVARIDGPDRPLCGLHRTYLSPDAPAKAKLRPNKAMLGRCAGAAVHLRSGKGALVVAEGIETSLSLGDKLENDFAIWAALSTTGMSRLMLPAPGDYNNTLIVAVDGDAPGRNAGRRLRDRAQQSGWKVETLSAPDGLDFNDLARRRADHEC